MVDQKFHVEINSNNKSKTSDFITLSHHALVKLCLTSTSHAAWEEFYNRFTKYIRYYIFSCWKKHVNDDYAIPDELTHDVFVTLLTNNQQVLKQCTAQTDTSFLAYLQAISKNIVLVYLRNYLIEKKSIFQTQSNKDNHAYIYSIERKRYSKNYISKESDRILNLILVKEILSHFYETIDSRQKQRDIYLFDLHVIDGLTMPQIVRLQEGKLSLRAIESILRRMKAKFIRIVNLYLKEV